MDAKEARTLMRKYSGALAYIEIENKEKDIGIGSCFHVGDGIFVTARHVIEGNTITKVKITEPVAMPTTEFFPEISNERADEYDKVVGDILGTTPLFKHYQSDLTLTEGPFYHPDENVDVAIFKVSNIHPSTGVVPLGSHLDDWIDRFDWPMSEAIILGYPPIPQTFGPHLVGARAEINATVGLYSTRHVHFILSATPRGGFSGGLALSEYGFALGVITQSLVRDYLQAETGFFAVLSIEPIYKCLSHHKMLPNGQKKGWDDFWNTHSVDYIYPKDSRKPSYQIASLKMIDDGVKIGIGICLYDKPIFDEVDSLIRSSMIGEFCTTKIHDMFYKYTYAIATEDKIQVVRSVLLKLMHVFMSKDLVSVRDDVTPWLTD